VLWPHCPQTLHTISGETRWNGWFLLIRQAFNIRPVLDAFYRRFGDELDDIALTSTEWKLLEYTYSFLQPFHQATVLAESDKTTLYSMQQYTDLLLYHSKQSDASYSAYTPFLTVTNTSWYILNKNYEKIDKVLAYVVTILLCPWRRLGLKRVKELWIEYQQRYEDEIPSILAKTSYVGTEPTAHELWMRTSEAVVAGDDVTSFINAEPTKLANNQGPIGWWCVPVQRMAYPALSRLAIDVLLAFSISAESERVFSGCRRTVKGQRSRLSSDIISYSECWKAWQRSGVAAIPLITSDFDDNMDSYGPLGAPSAAF
jgi:hypothetical protein